MFDTKPTSESTDRSDEFEDSVAAVLSSSTRKYVLAALARADDGLTLDELARAVSDADGVNCDRDAAEDEERVTGVLLYHCDVPKLADHELLEWNGDANRATLTPKGSACATALGL